MLRFETEWLLTLFEACIITVIIETVIFRLFKWKDLQDLKIVALTNVVTNLLLNFILSLCPDLYYSFWLVILELLVIAAEYLIYRRAFGHSRRLVIAVILANVVTFFIGILLEETVFWMF